MCGEDCYHYRKIKKMDNKNWVCLNFTGDKNNKYQVNFCRRWCEFYGREGLNVLQIHGNRNQ